MHEIVNLFYPSLDTLGFFQAVAKVPAPFDRLLDHHDHMTVALEQFHGCAVGVEVLNRHVTPSHYAREIILRRESDGQIVQYGIVRLDKRQLDSDVRREIENESTPVGRILIEHQVLREVKMLQLWQFSPSTTLQKVISDALGEPTAMQATSYGRTAFIYTGQAPAVELFEAIVKV